MAKPRSPRTSRRRKHYWAAYEDAKLLEVPLRDIDVSLAGTWVESCLDDLHAEMAARGLEARAHGWISDEWFSPQDTPGIAIPFYLLHPRLIRLERKVMLEAEGGTQRDCMRLLRHEAGHVVQYAYGLHRRKRWQALFGRATEPYPEHYRANPGSRRYVQHLRRWYAQCHPDEDFAETFAVWLTPRLNWRKRYADWPALKKLEYVDELMAELDGVKPQPKPRFHVEPIARMKGTLGDYYAAKHDRYAVDAPSVFDRDLRRIFSDEPRHRSAPLAAALIRRNRAQIIRSVARWTGEYPLALDAALDDMMRRCRALKLRAPGSEAKLRLDLTAMLSSKSVYTQYSTSRRQWFAV